jgi:hypothetical protein
MAIFTCTKWSELATFRLLLSPNLVNHIIRERRAARYQMVPIRCTVQWWHKIKIQKQLPPCNILPDLSVKLCMLNFTISQKSVFLFFKKKWRRSIVREFVSLPCSNIEWAWLLTNKKSHLKLPHRLEQTLVYTLLFSVLLPTFFPSQFF